jgi:hypothetical protein
MTPFTKLMQDLKTILPPEWRLQMRGNSRHNRYICMNEGSRCEDRPHIHWWEEWLVEENIEAERVLNGLPFPTHTAIMDLLQPWIIVSRLEGRGEK